MFGQIFRLQRSRIEPKRNSLLSLEAFDLKNLIWFEIVWYMELKWWNPSPATWVWMRNCQEIYQTKSSNLIWKCFDIWNLCRKAQNRVEMTEPKSSNLIVNEKLSGNLTNQVQQLDLKLFWYMGFRSKSRKQLKWRNPSPATWVWIRNCQQIYQTKSSNLIWKCFDIWNSCQKAENNVKMT